MWVRNYDFYVHIKQIPILASTKTLGLSDPYLKPPSLNIKNFSLFLLGQAADVR